MATNKTAEEWALVKGLGLFSHSVDGLLAMQREGGITEAGMELLARKVSTELLLARAHECKQIAGELSANFGHIRAFHDLSTKLMARAARFVEVAERMENGRVQEAQLDAGT